MVNISESDPELFGQLCYYSSNYALGGKFTSRFHTSRAHVKLDECINKPRRERSVRTYCFIQEARNLWSNQ